MPTPVFKDRRKKYFTKNIMLWNQQSNKRIMPWKGEKDPYKIWISEIILQQTRVVQGFLYYQNFIEQYPTLKSLAEAEDDAVFKVWEGLGYYSRCKNILITARHISNNLHGKFPDTYEEILGLKGIGPYTAAAISSFAYGLPHAVVDGNVFRVLARYFGETTAIDSEKGKLYFAELANNMLYKSDPGSYNQAIMDFGATICKPQIAECQECILRKNCSAYKNGLVNKLPVKEKKLQKSKRWFYYFIFLYNNDVLINKRKEKDIWQNLNEFYLYEFEKPIDWTPDAINQWLKEQLGIKKYRLLQLSEKFHQQLTHQHLQGQFIVIDLKIIPASLKHLDLVKVSDLQLLAFPKLINNFLHLHPLKPRKNS
jgi:A/G-specific adenine glycosylase